MRECLLCHGGVGGRVERGGGLSVRFCSALLCYGKGAPRRLYCVVLVKGVVPFAIIISFERPRIFSFID